MEESKNNKHPELSRIIEETRACLADASDSAKLTMIALLLTRAVWHLENIDGATDEMSCDL